jgi:hypothetical protein
MPSTLRNRLNDLAASFSAGVLDAIRGASLEELLSESSGGKSRASLRLPAAGSAPTSAAAPRRRRSGRLPRRSAGDISQAVEKIIGLLSTNPGGLRAEQIRQKLGIQAKELPRPLKEGLEEGRLSKVGRKRATTYFAGTAPKREKTAASAPRAGRRRKASAGAKRRAAKTSKNKTRAKKSKPRAAAPKRRRSKAPKKS